MASTGARSLANGKRYSVQRLGWGMFEVGIQLVLRTGETHTFRHMLSFDGDGSGANQAHSVPIPRETLDAAREEVAALRRLSAARER